MGTTGWTQSLPSHCVLSCPPKKLSPTSRPADMGSLTNEVSAAVELSQLQAHPLGKPVDMLPVRSCMMNSATGLYTTTCSGFCVMAGQPLPTPPWPSPPVDVGMIKTMSPPFGLTAPAPGGKVVV